jgi:hypothetical protein
MNSLFWKAARECIRDATTAGRDGLLESLRTGTAEWVRAINTASADASLPHRLTAFAATFDAEFGDRIGSYHPAVEAFEQGWVGSRPTLPPTGPDHRAVDSLDGRANGLPLSTVGGWLVYDVLWHLRHSAKEGRPPASGGGLAAREETAVLGAGGAGRVMKLVVELLPGPPGLVTPDWWPMGLIQFPQRPVVGSDKTHQQFADFVASTQKLLSACVDAKQPYRLRWRLEPYRPHDPLDSGPFSGRSAEAAVVSAGLTVYERLGQPDRPVLNPNVCITAVVDGDDEDVRKRPLTPVNEATISDKFRAAAEAGLHEVLVATGQQPDPLPEPVVLRRADDPGARLALRSHVVATVDAAYQEIVTVNKYVRAFQDAVVREHDGKWVMEATPAGDPK